MKWYEDEKLWENFYPCMFDDESFALAKTQCPQILEMVGHKVEKVLDLACGPGRHVIAFAELGLDVTGVDISGFLLNLAANKVDQLSLDARLVHADLLKFETTEKYDLITNMFTSFGYYENPDDNQKVLKNAYEMLSSGGSLLIDTFGKEQVAQVIEPVHLTEYENGDIRIERPLLINNMSVLSNEWLLIRGEEAFRRSYQHFVYSAVEMEQMLKQAGFSDIRIYGSLHGEEYGLDTERLIAVAQK